MLSHVVLQEARGLRGLEVASEQSAEDPAQVAE